MLPFLQHRGYKKASFTAYGVPTCNITELGSRYQIVVTCGMSVASVLQPAPAVPLVEGEGNAGWVFLTAG